VLAQDPLSSVTNTKGRNARRQIHVSWKHRPACS